MIPEVRAGKDLVVQAQTGTGKTAAYVVPILALHYDPKIPVPPGISVLTLVPTRELALQVASVFKDCARNAPRRVRVVSVIGGEPVESQLIRLRADVDVLVATPGRLIDLIQRGVVDLSHVRWLVLDEADKLLDLGFGDALGTVLDALPQTRQNLLLSATLPPRVHALGQAFLQEPVTLSLGEETAAVAAIEQRVFEVDRNKRRQLLQHLMGQDWWTSALVFVASRKAAENLASKLHGAGLCVAPLHGDMDQTQRSHVLRGLKHGTYKTIIATDLASRGLDVRGLAVVLNYDLPRSPDDYIHRIGRTGRAGATGIALSFVDHDSQAHFRLIEKRSGVRLEREQIEGFPLTGQAPDKTKGAQPVKGLRKSKKDKLREAAAREVAARTAAAEKPE